jgi:hypothetical protein
LGIPEYTRRSTLAAELDAQRRLQERLTVLVDASSNLLLGSLELNRVVPRILELARRLIYADAYAVWRAGPGMPKWHIVSSVGLPEGYESEALKAADPDWQLPDGRKTGRCDSWPSVTWTLRR